MAMVLVPFRMSSFLTTNCFLWEHSDWYIRIISNKVHIVTSHPGHRPRNEGSLNYVRKLMFMENRPSHTHFHYWLTTNCLIWCLQYCKIYVNYVLNGCIMITVAAKGQLCSSLTKDQNFSLANRRIVTTIRSNTTTCRRWKNWTWIYSSPGVNDSLKLKSNKNN